MGGNTHSKPKEDFGKKFVEWLNAADFDDDEEMVQALTEIASECTARLSAMAGDVEQTSKD